MDIDNMSLNELQELRDRVNKRICDFYRIHKPISEPNPCVGCKQLWKQGHLDGSITYACSYVNCKYGYKNANPEGVK